MLTKQEIKKLLDSPCKTRGEYISAFKKEVVRLGGEEAVERFEKEVSKKIDSPFEFKKIKSLEWYTSGIRTACLVTLKEVFNLKDDHFVQMGARSIKDSLVVKFFLKYFSSRETAFKYIPKYWRKFCTCGRLEPIELIQTKDGKEGHFIVRLHDFKIHPLHCQFLLGAFLQLARFLGGKNSKIKETKCMHNGDPYHEYLIKWGE